MSETNFKEESICYVCGKKPEISHKVTYIGNIQIGKPFISKCQYCLQNICYNCMCINKDTLKNLHMVWVNDDEVDNFDELTNPKTYEGLKFLESKFPPWWFKSFCKNCESINNYYILK
jgi:hypothetical protein